MFRLSGSHLAPLAPQKRAWLLCVGTHTNYIPTFDDLGFEESYEDPTDRGDGPMSLKRGVS